VWSRRTNDFDFDLLVYVANWPERRSAAWQRLLPARAIENQCYVAGVNRVGADGNGIPHAGDSVILDFSGECLAGAQRSQENILSAGLDREKLHSFRKDFPFWQDADGFDLK
jgi:predicted amidohydrolase